MEKERVEVDVDWVLVRWINGEVAAGRFPSRDAAIQFVLYQEMNRRMRHRLPE